MKMRESRDDWGPFEQMSVTVPFAPPSSGVTEIKKTKTVISPDGIQEWIDSVVRSVRILRCNFDFDFDFIEWCFIVDRPNDVADIVLTRDSRN